MLTTLDHFSSMTNNRTMATDTMTYRDVNSDRSRARSGRQGHMWSGSALFALILTLTCGSIAHIPQAQALTMRPYTLAELSSEASLIARGRVSKLRAYREKGRIFTEVTITLTTPLLKGSHPLARRDSGAREETGTSQISFSILGGSLHGISQVIPGAPRVTINDELITFLRCESSAQGARRCSPVGFGQGLWRPQGAQWRPLTDQVRWTGNVKPLRELSFEQLTQGLAPR